MTPEERAWEVVRRAYEERTPVPRRAARNRRLLVAVIALAAAVVAVVSPPGHAVFERVRTAVGAPPPTRLVLPAAGRLLVQSAEHGGTWVVTADGRKRRIGAWQYASWSPHGLYIGAADGNKLVALEPNGRIRWSLTRPDVSWPVWEGTLTDTRIAYYSGGALHVVAGDGSGDRLFDPYPVVGPLAWDPARLHTLTYVAGDEVLVRAVDSGTLVWQHKISFTPVRLAWSSDGTRLAIVALTHVLVLDASGRRLASISTGGVEVRSAAFRPRTHELTLSGSRELPTRRSRVLLVDVDRAGSSRVLFSGPGAFGDIAWSPSGGWLLVDWPTADEWLFVKPGAHPRVLAVGHIARQFPRPDGLGPELQLAGGWCCASR